MQEMSRLFNPPEMVLLTKLQLALSGNGSLLPATNGLLRADTHTYVAEDDGHVVGTYILRANQPGSGSHVANAAFMVAPTARGQGIGRAMGENCLSEARRLGFRAMQFNFVVSTNEGAIRLWKQLGFKIVATLPGAFRHPQKGYVDVYVMFRSLEEAGKG